MRSRMEIKMKIAMVQFDAELFEVQNNQKKAEKYINQAIEEGAEMILFPEFFTTGFALHRKLYEAVLQNIEIRNWIQNLSREKKVILGGSWLEYDREKQNTYNTYGLFFPTGEQFFHRKDIPTAIENFCYTNGDEQMLFDTPIGRVGIAMCWEQLRTVTLKRMLGKVDLVVAGSCWWGFAKEDGEVSSILSEENRKLADKAPGNLARMLGKPVYHSSIYGSYEGGSLMDINKNCIRNIESRSMAFDKDGKRMNDCLDIPGIVYADYMKEEQTKEHINEQEIMDIQDSYWLMAMSKPLESGFNMLNQKYHEFYEKTGRCIYRKMFGDFENE